MKRFSKVLVYSILVAMLAMATSITFAQDEEGPDTGSGDPIIAPNLGNDISTLNPILSSDGSSNTVIANILPTLIAISPETLSYEPGAAGGIVTDFTVSDDGLVYTMNLRDDWAWSDGTPITAADYVYSFEAIASGETTTSLTYVLDDVANVEALDDFTLEITTNSPSCEALDNITAIPVVPSHVYQEWFPTFADMNESPRNLGVQPATADAWEFRNFRPGEQVTLTADADYPDAFTGNVIPEGWVFRNVANQQLIVEEFLSENLSYIGSVPSDRKDEIRALGDEGLAQVYETPATSVRFIALNTADPSNPQAGLDEDGNAIDQGFHPILGDVRVRQAMMHGLDWEEANQAVFNGEGIQLASHWLPTGFAYDPDLPFYEFDLEMADALLTEAGFTDSDGDGIRECNGCLYGEEGAPMTLDFVTNAGNTENEALGVLLQDQWGAIGIDLDFQAIDFGVLVDTLLSQTYDMVMIFWGFGFPSGPTGDIVTTFGPQNDVPEGGFNTTSTNIPRLNELTTQGNDPAQTNGCDIATRAEIYGEAYQILRDEVPWIWVSTSIVTAAGQPYIENWDPRPGVGLAWNDDSWIIDRAGFEAQSR